MANYQVDTDAQEYHIESIRCASADCQRPNVDENFVYFYRRAIFQQQTSEQSVMTQSSNRPPKNFISIVCDHCNKGFQSSGGKAIDTFKRQFSNQQQYQISFNKNGSSAQDVPLIGKMIRSRIYCSECRTSEIGLQQADEKIKKYACHGKETSLMAAQYYAEQQYKADQEQLNYLKYQLNQNEISQLRKCLILNKIQQILKRYQTNQQQ